MAVEFFNIDCMDYLADCPDNAFQLAIVDPPYGISAPRMAMGEGYCDGKYNRLRGSGKLKNRILNSSNTEWDLTPPGPEYFEELRRVSQHQIIWGGNYFQLPPTRCVVCWDKEHPWENFSQWEMAWTSFDKPAALFRRGNGLQEPGKIHPTQKPVKLYEWLLARFAEPGWRILDTHLGSGSSAIAAHYGGFDFIGCEVSKEYFDAAQARFDNETAQSGMNFD